MTRRRPALAVAIVVAAAALVAWRLGRPRLVEPLPESRVLHSATLDGTAYKLADDGRVYRVDAGTGRWAFESVAFDPRVVAGTYAVEAGTRYRLDPDTGRRHRTVRQLREDFEGLPAGAGGLRLLVGPARGWTGFTLQSPLAPTVPDYVELRRSILNGGEFRDARVEPSAIRAHSGTMALRCDCPPRARRTECSKAHLETSLVYFARGDDVWYRAWYFVEGAARPHTLVDLESDLLTGSPGVRVMAFGAGDLGVELKALGKPTFRQSEARRMRFPTGEWVRLTWHLRLDAGDAGRCRLWQGDDLLLDTRGPTLPFAGAIYNSLEVGVTAHAFGDAPAVVYVDDIELGTEPLRAD